MNPVLGLAAGAAFLLGGAAFASQKLGQPLGERPPEQLYANHILSPGKSGIR